MGLLKFMLGMKDVEVTGKMHAGTLAERFAEQFGTVIRVYKPSKSGAINTGRGSRPADEKDTLASLCATGCKVTSITLRKSHSVREVERAFAEQMGIGVQIMLPDGKTFAPDQMRLQDVAKSIG